MANGNMEWPVWAISTNRTACSRGERWGGVVIIWPLRLAQRPDGIYGAAAQENFRLGIRLQDIPANGDGVRLGWQAY